MNKDYFKELGFFVKEFIKDCLLFQSRDTLDWLFGLGGWSTIITFFYATHNYYSLTH